MTRWPSQHRIKIFSTDLMFTAQILQNKRYKPLSGQSIKLLNSTLLQTLPSSVFPFLAISKKQRDAQDSIATRVITIIGTRWRRIGRICRKEGMNHLFLIWRTPRRIVRWSKSGRRWRVLKRRWRRRVTRARRSRSCRMIRAGVPFICCHFSTNFSLQRVVNDRTKNKSLIHLCFSHCFLFSLIYIRYEAFLNEKFSSNLL
jgi:hypothetical protein